MATGVAGSGVGETLLENTNGHNKKQAGDSIEPVDDDVYVLQHTDGEQEEHRMLIYEPVEGIPIGLEPLLDVTEVAFTTGLPLPVSFDVVVNRNYNITNQARQKIFHCGEKTNHCIDYCCNGHRPFELHFFNGHGKTVMTAGQLCTLCLSFFRAECDGANLTMRLVSGDLLGTIKQRYSCCWPHYEVSNSTGVHVMRLEGPGGGVWTQICGRKFKVFLYNLTYGNESQDVIATIDKRTVYMPVDLSVVNKALLLGCLFIAEQDYYQSSRTYGKVLFVVSILFSTLIFMGLMYPDYYS